MNGCGRLLVALFAAGLASGCAGLSDLRLAERPVYGRVAYFSAEDGLAVVRMIPGIPVPAGDVVARDAQTLQPTARLVATRARSGTHVTFQVRDGRPGPGDEVVAGDPPPDEG